MALKALALLVALAVLPASALATPRTLVKSGRWATASNWSPEGKPTFADPVEVAAGKEAKIEAPAKSGPLTLRGVLAGHSNLEVDGSVNFEGSLPWTGTLKLIGLGSVALGATEPLGLEVEGWFTLTEAARAFSNFRVLGTLNSVGYQVTVQGDTYLGIGSTLTLGSSVWQTGEWRPQVPTEMSLSAEAATIVLKDPSEGTFEGQKHTYGNVTIEGFNPHSKTPYTVLGTLALNQTEDGTAIKLESGQTITTASLASNGVLGAPVEAHSSTPGSAAVIALGADEELTASLKLTDIHITGHTLYLPNGTDGGGNSGVVFAPGP